MTGWRWLTWLEKGALKDAVEFGRPDSVAHRDLISKRVEFIVTGWAIDDALTEGVGSSGDGREPEQEDTLEDWIDGLSASGGGSGD